MTSTLKRNVATLSVSPTTRSILRTDVRRLSARQGRRGYLPCQQDQHNQFKPHFKRRPGQICVAYSLDPPPHLWWNDYTSPAWRGVFNWTMTYRTDSHIFSPVGRLVRRQTTVPPKYTAVASRKTKSIAWFLSKYDTMYKYGSEREKYVKELRKYTDVNIFGECNPHKCPKSDWSLHGYFDLQVPLLSGAHTQCQ